jgi:hypothetical protein
MRVLIAVILFRPGGLEQPDHLGVAARASEHKRRVALAVGELQVRAPLDQRAQRFLVPASAVAEHDRFDHRGPMEVVHVIERRARRDQRGAVVAAGDELGARAERKQQAQGLSSSATAAIVTQS